MKSKIEIIVVVLFTFVCAPLIRQAAALDLVQNSSQLWSIGRESTQNGLNYRESTRVKKKRPALILHRENMLAKAPHGDLLQELLASEVVHHESSHLTEVALASQRIGHEGTAPETDLLEELLVK